MRRFDIIKWLWVAGMVYTFLQGYTFYTQRRGEELASTHIKEFLDKMSQMGFDYNKTVALLEKLGKESQQ